MYYDSAIHAQIIEDLQNQAGTPESDTTLSLISQRYYHVGFHHMIVVLAAQLRGSFDNAKLILIAGHLFLVLLSLNLGLLASKLFNNFYAGIATLVFASLGWTMPAYAINWGKYPALSSLAVFPLAIYWMIDLFRSSNQSRRFHIWLCGISSLCAVLLHSRSLILLGCSLTAIIATVMIWKLLYRNTAKLLFYFVIGLLLMIVPFHQNFQAAFSPYLKGVDLIATVWAVVSLFFIASQDLKIAMGILAFILSVMIISIIPTPEFLVRQAGRYLVDRPFLELLLVLPMSLVAGGSLAYFIGKLNSRISKPMNGKRIVHMAILSVAVVMVMMRPISDFKPNPCCVYMTVDDTFLIGWMQENISQPSRILISTNDDLNTRFVKVATDAGAWIALLTKLKTIKFDYRTDFSNPAVYRALCEQNIEYIYVSLANTSFSIPLLEQDKQHYSPTFILPDARLYHVNCNTF